jgi:DNA helicase-2/ATP-dependent DNA helicase PcrA
MIVHHNMDPSSICAVTFTNKAVNEMRARLIKLIGKERVDKVKMGTFHSLCALFLRKHGRVVDLDGNFTICDSEERYVAEAGTVV